MTWVRLDDKLPNHAKVAGLSDSAFRTWVEALCLSAGNDLDGNLTAAQVRRLARPEADRKELLEAGLWEPFERDGIAIHDFLDYHPSRAQVQARRDAVTARVKRHREKEDTTEPPSLVEPVNGVTVKFVTPPPSRPVPSPALPTGSACPRLDPPSVLPVAPCADAPGLTANSERGKKARKAPRSPPERPHPCPEPSELTARAGPEWWAAQAAKHAATIGELERHVPEFCVYWQRRSENKTTRYWLAALANQFERLAKREVLHSGGVPRGAELHARTSREPDRPRFRRRPEPDPLSPAEREAMANQALRSIGR